MKSPIIDGPANEKEIKKLEKKLKKASENSHDNFSEKDTYYGLDRIKEKKESSVFWKFVVLLLFILLIILSIGLLSGIISGKIDVLGLFKQLNKN